MSSTTNRYFHHGLKLDKKWKLLVEVTLLYVLLLKQNPTLFSQSESKPESIEQGGIQLQGFVKLLSFLNLVT